MENNQQQNPNPVVPPVTPVNNPVATPATPTQQSTPVIQTNKSGVGSIIATIIIIAVIILGGLYFWGKRIETQKMEQALLQNSDNTQTEETASAIEATRIETVSQDDSLNTISSEIKTTNTTNLTPELE